MPNVSLTLGKGNSFPKGFDANNELLFAPRLHLSTDVLFQFVPDTFNQIYIGLGTLKVSATS